MFRAILNLLRGYDTRYSELELRIFEEMTELLKPLDRQRLKERLSKIGKIYRLDGGRETIFYQLENGKVVFPTETRISTIDGVAKFAEFTIKSPSNMTSNRGNVRIHDGNIAALEFRRPIEHAEVNDITSIDMKILNVEYDKDDDLR